MHKRSGRGRAKGAALSVLGVYSLGRSSEKPHLGVAVVGRVAVAWFAPLGLLSAIMGESNERAPEAVGVRSPDGYEAKYMTGGGTILHREKSVGPWYFHLIFLLPLLLTIGAPLATVITGGALPLAALASIGAVGLILFLSWMLFVVLRVTVSSTELHVQYGLFGPKIPISSISKVTAVDYDWKEFGGWGIKRSFKDGAWIYNMWGDKGRAVRVTYDDGGKEKTVVIGCAHANLVADAVQQAMAAMASATGRARLPKSAAGIIDAEVEEAVAQGASSPQRKNAGE